MGIGYHTSTSYGWRPEFTLTSLDLLKQFIDDGPVGNRWFKVNLHTHAQGHDPAEIVRQARQAEIDLLAVTDHQTFAFCDMVSAEATTPGRALVVLPGIEITAHEGAHVLAIFPSTFSTTARTHLLGWLELDGSGDTKVASRRGLADIFKRVDENNGVLVVPHPFSDGIGMLDSARKISTKTDWLESGYVRLIQIEEDKVRYIERDENENWFNRYMLASARQENIRSATYSLAPFNRSDAHRPEEIPLGCSWFRMERPTIEGLKQVACEPRTRISRVPPAVPSHACLFGVRVTGGYCDGQVFRFNEALNCVVGQNYAGKSSVFDFIRFGLAQEHTVPSESRDKLLSRIYGILQLGGNIELYVRQGRDFYIVKRAFNPPITGTGPNVKIGRCDPPTVYRFDPPSGRLVPVDNLMFSVDVYEQGRIHRLREDVSRQLAMIDEFAGIGDLKQQREVLIQQLTDSARLLAPLYDEREQLISEIAGLPPLKQELAEKEKFLPGEEELQQEKKWARELTVVEALETVVNDLATASARVPLGGKATLSDRKTDLERLFNQQPPSADQTEVVHPELLLQWKSRIESALLSIGQARDKMLQAIRALATESEQLKTTWQQERDAYEQRISEQLAKAGVESPKEIINRVATLRSTINTIERKKQPRLAEVNKSIDEKETEREALLKQLEGVDSEVTKRRQDKARELTTALGGQIKVTIQAGADRAEYQRVLNELSDEVGSRDHRIQNRDGQLNLIMASVSPLRLAKALKQKGTVQQADGTVIVLKDLCGVTENTQDVLCRIAQGIQLLNRLQTITVPDVPEILVKRRGEASYADLRTGLSPGEQSAAILTLALHTRTQPLILDQPEDELGYSYVAHLIVPKILDAKFSRQLLIVTHNANIPVLGDADYVIKMENNPCSERGRRCIAAEAGCFESADVTKALIELEGGEQAFRFRRYRYGLPRAEQEPKVAVTDTTQPVERDAHRVDSEKTKIAAALTG